MLEGLRLARRRVQAIAALTLAITLALGTANAQKGAISFVQVNSAAPQKAQNPVAVTYTAAQTAGDLNVVAVGWNDSAVTVSSVVDSAGNAYALAVGPTAQSGTATQSIYYAKNINAAAASENTVTVTFNAAPHFPDIRIAEYKGLDPSNPVDVTVGAQGTSKSSNSGSVTTTNAKDLLVGANLVQTTTTAAGTAYTSRVITAPDGDILEDRVVTTTGSYNATASISPSGKWIMQMVAFRAAGSGAGTSPSITSVSPTSGPVGASVTIAGANFGSTQGTSTVTFNGTVATPTGWSATSVAAPVPTGATTGNVVVTVGGQASNGVSFTVTTPSPSITSVSPTSGPVGASVTIAGANFGSTQGTSTVTFNGTVATPKSWSATSVVAPVPTGATTGNIMVTVGGQASNGVSFTVTTPSPSITSVSPTSGPVGTSVTIAGANFGSTQGTSTVTFNGTVATPTGWSATSVAAPVPTGATTGNIMVTVGGQASNGVSFTVTTPSPSITSVSPTSGPVGTSVTIAGANFGSTQGTSTVTFNGTVATPKSWSATSVVAPVPTGATTGNIMVTVGGQASNGVSFTVTTPSPSITSVSPTSGPVGTSVTIAGANFGSTQGTSTVTFNGTVAAPTGWSATSIAVPVPSGATTGNVTVTVGGVASNAVRFTVTAPTAISFVQANFATPQAPQTKVSVTYVNAQVAGHLNMVVVGWNDSTATIGSIEDSAGNTYSLAVGPTVQTGTATQAIYYAKNIVAAAANTNSVTVTFSAAANYPDIRIAEYAGLDPSNPVDVAEAAQGTSTSSSSGSVTTTNANDLLIGANVVQTLTTAAGTGYTSRVITAPDGDILEDRVVTTTGSYSATASVSPSGKWIMQMVAFRAAGSGAGMSPGITSVSPSSGPVGTSVTVTGTNFGSTQGTSTVTFNGTVARPTSWSATTIVAPVPNGASTGNIAVTVGGVASNGVAFTVSASALSITSLSPSSGPVGTSVTIAGTNFGSTQGASTVTFDGAVATPTSWSATTIVAPVPAGATTGNVVVTVGGQSSNGVNFTVTAISSGEPTLIQHVSSSNTRSYGLGSPSCYYSQLPNPTTLGNTVIIGFTFGSNPTPTVTDDQGDSYTIVENYYDSADSQSVAIAAAFNVSAGARNISVCFSSDPGGLVQPMATEFNNVVAVDGSGAGSQGTGTAVTAGSLTPALSGDLAYQVVFSLSVNQSSFTAGSQGNIAWNLLSADLMDGWAGQYGIYNSTSAFNPTLSMGTSQKWVSAAILLQTGTAGSVPSGMRIVRLVHENIPYHTAAGGTGNPFPNPLPLQLPSSGNLLVAMIGGGNASETVASMTDTNNNTWTQAGSTFVNGDNDTVQTYYAGNATSSSNLGLTLNWTGEAGDFTIFFYDVTGAATSPLDTTNGATGSQSSTSGTLAVPYTLTPAQSGELIFTDIIWDNNTGTGLSSNTGTSYFDTNTFPGEPLDGPEPVDENNGWGHAIYTSTSAITFTWSQLSTSTEAGGWASMAVAFLAAEPPGN